MFINRANTTIVAMAASATRLIYSQTCCHQGFFEFCSLIGYLFHNDLDLKCLIEK